MRITLAGLLVVPLVSLVALWAFAASITLGNAVREHNYNRLVALSAAPTDELANQVSQERQQTFTWLSTDPRPPEAQLAGTRDRTNAAVTAYRRLVQQTQGLRPASAEAAQATLMTHAVQACRPSGPRSRPRYSARPPRSAPTATS